MENKITIADVQGIIALAILNNKSGVMAAMNSSGYPVAYDISDNDLFRALAVIGDKNGIGELQSILSKVSFDASKFTQEELQNLLLKFNITNPVPNTSGKSGWFNNAITNIGDFFSGSTVINTNPNQQTSESELPTWAVLLTAIIGIIAIVFVQRKQVKGANVISIVIGMVVISVVLYGIFAKKITISGGGASQIVHNGALGWIKGVLNGLNVSVLG